MIDVSVLVVCYRSREYVGDCLAGLYEHTRGVSFEVLLLDNSDDGAAEWVREHYPQTTVIDNRDNLGFAGGNNALADHARGRYLLLLNPDTLVRDNAVGELAACAAAHPGHGAWGGVTVYPSGEREPTSQQAAPGLWSELLLALGLGRLRRGGLPAGASAPREVAVLSGAFMMVEASLWRELGGFDPSFFLYSEEVDFCCRLRRRTGRRPIMTPASRVVHLVGKSSGDSAERALGIYRGKMHLDRKLHGGWHVGALGAVMWLGAAVRWGMGGVLRPLLGAERAQRWRQRYAADARRPGAWWGGYGPPAPARDAASVQPGFGS